MNAVVESVKSLWVPLEEVNLLVPNVAIAEVINYQPLDLIHDGPDWLLGCLRWREQELPVVSAERLCGFNLPQGERGSRISVINSMIPGADLSFYAIVTAGIPRLFSADEDALGSSVLGDRGLPDTVADCVQIGNEEALIPDLENIQTLVGKAWAAAGK
ncbi:MAG: chemotaxis protein CheW [Gammaproteobacteria bacterium]|nr:MAG: chemotaxis protein CheW [Gammaproteobacteria bacterium]